MMGNMAGFLANLQASTTNSGDTMQQLVETNATLQASAVASTSGGLSLTQLATNNTTLTTANATQAKKLAGARLKIATLKKKLRKANQRHGNTTNTSNNLGSAIAYTIVRHSGQGTPASWKIGGYCFKHKFGCNHPSDVCRTGITDAGYKKEATRLNTMGSCQDNKG